MNSLMISVSGVRGIVGETLMPEIVVKFGVAFGKFVREKRVVIGSDTRTSNQMFRYALFSGLLSVGCKVIDVGICPTPSIQLMVEKLKAGGGIIITGSHNPVEWNALKFVRHDGIFLYPEEGERLLTIYKEKRIKRAAWNEIKSVYYDTSAIENHLEKLLEIVDKDNIRRKKFKVVLDACNGAASKISPLLLRRLGCKVTEINCKPDGVFPHSPEPIPSNLRELSLKVKTEKADIGFAHDADADRIAIATEEGNVLPEDYPLLLATKFVLGGKRGLVVTNLSTTSALDDIAREFKCKVMRTRIGDVNVSKCMKEHNAVIGGEGNGGVIIPQVHYARDGMAAIALILEYITKSNKTVSALANELPKYYTIKGKLEFPREKFVLLESILKEEFKNYELNFLDGVKVILKEGWIHIRLSGTEPIIRIFAEAKNKEKAEELFKTGIREVEKVLVAR
ncbi:phosphoglucosamine mutase [Candidatus Aerophobetes bacterium]|nr:phosphoglucosamine mutase [Candidatus Aerophobetes bacterium]